MNRLELAETFIAVVDCGSIHQAARKLHITASAISKKLNKLENHLGLQLLERTTKGIKLNEAGHEYYHQVKTAILNFTKLESAFIESELQPHGILRVTTNSHYYQNNILPKLSKFIKHFPDIKLHFNIQEITPDFVAHKMDILFGVSITGSDDLIQKSIEQTRYLLCASDLYLKKYGIPKSTNDLLQHQILAHSKRTKPQVIHLDKDEVAIANPFLYIDNTAALIQAALNHLGIIWTHECLVAEYLKRKKLITILPEKTKNKFNVYVYYPSNKILDAKTKVFMKFFAG